ncbi:MAG: peptide ABC transporter substrate-binding protein [Clostridia bacterium]|nr:peptide ABC transporter substrate-binding protein [Clostridia bacterium]
MMKKILCVVITVILLILCGCTKDTGEGKEIVFPIDEPLAYLDPQIVSSSSGRIAVKNCFEGLVRTDENGTVQPAAASDWSVSEKGTVYTFNLRKDAVWYIPKAVKLYDKQVGEETVKDLPVLSVTADDFVFAFTRAVSPDTESAYAQSLSKIKNAQAIILGKMKPEKLGVKAVDEYTLEITLASADDDFLYLLTSPVCMPCNRGFFEKTGGRYGIGSEYMIYNGPFYISSWSSWSDGSAVLKPNESYNGSFKAKPSSVYLSQNSEQDTRLEKLENGIYDAAPLTSDQTASVGTVAGVRVYSFKNGIKGFLFNCADENLKNSTVRKALLYSLDLSVPGGEQVGGIVPDACIASGSGYREAAGKLDFPQINKKAASKYWQKALEKLKKSSISITVLCGTDDETAVRRIMQDWQALFGVSADIKCEAVEPHELSERIQSGDYQLALAQLTAQTEYASDFLMSFTSSSANNTVRFSNAEYDALMLRCVKAKGTVKTVSALKEAEQYLISQAVIIPVDNSEVYYGTAGNVSGAVFSFTGELIDFSQTIKYD